MSASLAQGLKFEGTTFNITQPSDAECVEAAGMLATNKNVKDVIIINASGEGTTAIITALLKCKTVESLSVHALNAILQGKAIAPLFASQSITSVSISGAHIMDVKSVTNQLQANSKLRSLVLANSMGYGIGEFFSTLQKHECLTKLDVSNNQIDDKELNSIGEFLKVNRFVTSLNLSMCKITQLGKILAPLVQYSYEDEHRVIQAQGLDTQLRAAGLVDTSQEDVGLKPLKALDLSNNEFGNEGGKVLADALSVKSFLRLREINLANCGLTQLLPLAGGIVRHCSLTRVVLYNNHFDDKSGPGLLELFRASIKDLDISECHLKLSEEAAKALRDNRKLERLKFCNNPMAGCENYLAMVIAGNETLTSLSVQECGLISLKAIGEALAKNKALQTLELDKNGSPLTSEGNNLAVALRVNRTLTRLTLRHCNFKNLSELLQTLGHDPVLKSEPALTELDLTGNEIGQEASKVLLAAIKTNAMLTTLRTEYCEIPHEIWTQVVAKIAQNNPQMDEILESDAKMDRVAGGYPAAVGAGLSAATVQSLKDIEKRFSGIDPRALAILQGRYDTFQRLFELDNKMHEKDTELVRINGSLNLTIFYRYFAKLLTGTWMACQSIGSDMLENDEKFKSDYVGDGLNKIGKFIPGINVVTSLFSDTIKLWNYGDKKRAVQRMGSLFPDLETATTEIGKLSRAATLVQDKELNSLSVEKGSVAKLKELFQKAKAALLVDDADTPLKRRAVEDCKKLLVAIKEGKLSEKPSFEELMKAIMGPQYKYKPAEIDAKSAAAASPNQPMQTILAKPVITPHSAAVAAPDDAFLKIDHSKELAEIRRQLAEIEKRLLNEDEGVVVGDQGSIQLQRSKQTAGQSAANAEVNAMLLDRLEANDALLGNEVASLKDEQQQQRRDLNRLLAEKEKNGSCVIA